ncbi:MAG: hypothetical protein JXN60_05395, partial [Lentisphaerae bacterium]|nr:hypothetical protein [Lentisphaerota bacterium]
IRAVNGVGVVDLRVGVLHDVGIGRSVPRLDFVVEPVRASPGRRMGKPDDGIPERDRGERETPALLLRQWLRRYGHRRGRGGAGGLKLGRESLAEHLVGTGDKWRVASGRMSSP